ncbi:MAG: hypothetical protein WD904_00255 [Dehalococcoidia bacterium]
MSFVSSSSNLVNGDTNGVEDIFVHDRQTGDTTSLTAHSTGNRQAGGTHGTSISADGRFVTFRSEASDLIAGDSNAHWDIFVHDRQAAVTTRVSVDSGGTQANGTSWDAVISANGRLVAFSSDASNLVPGEVFINDDIFVHDRQTGVTTRVSIHTDGTEGDAGSYEAMISADGRYVGFYSWASNLVANDIDDWTDVFVHDRSTAATTRITLDDQGDQANSYNWGAAISANGRFVAFKSEATNLVPDDTNGWDDIFVRDRCADGSCATPDPDGDTFADSADNCPNWANIAQLLPAWTVAANDPDCDGFSTANETTIGTDPTRQCPGPGGTPDSWPPDVVANGTINILDVTALKPVFGQSVPPASARYNIAGGVGINILDVTALKPFFGKSCS